MMRCRQCWEAVGSDWVELTEVHANNLGDRYETTRVNAAVICAPPRVCLAEYAAARTKEIQEKDRTRPEWAEPF